MDEFNLGELAKTALEEAMRERGHANVLIAGQTGVGKSTLINSIFQGNSATTGQGRPVTQNTREITKEDVSLSVFDTRGLEMADFTTTLKALRSFIMKRQRALEALAKSADVERLTPLRIDPQTLTRGREAEKHCCRLAAARRPYRQPVLTSYCYPLHPTISYIVVDGQEARLGITLHPYAE